MRLSVFSVVDSYDDAPERDRYGELLDLAVAAEAAGLSTVWVAEHHFHSGGISPAPAVLLGAIAARTSRIRIGVLVSVLPFHNPIEVAEQFAMVDQLSHGRLNLGVGSGYIPMEFEGFGVDPATKRERFDAALLTVLAALQGEAVAPSSGPDGKRPLNVRPVQRPHPPVWIAAQRREALPFVARRGVNVALVPYATVASVDELASEIAEFRSHLPSGSRATVSVALHLYAGPHPQRARSALQRYLDSRLATQSAFYQDKVRRDPSHASAETIERTGFALFGAPPDVAQRLQAFRAAGVDEVLGIFDFGGLPASDAQRSVAALGPLVGPW
ncbi:MAG: LLM class flavin-dependent oxidoreductase [Thermoplasmata archaeon]|nr:LLM class flavin-dependent oxidoreductase [Thermoplasmata archaeon]